MRFLKFLSAGVFVFTSFAALVYLLWVIDEKNEDIVAKNDRIRRDSLSLIAKDNEIEKLSLAVNSLKGAYENIQRAFHSLSDRFSAMEQNNDSLKTRIEHLTISVNRLNKEKKQLKNEVVKEKTLRENFNSPDIAALAADLNKRGGAAPTHYRTLTEQEKEEHKMALLVADNFYIWSPEDAKTKVNSQKLNFSFEIQENFFAQKGKKELYIQITKPDGSVFNNSKEGGFFILNGKHQPFTTKIPVNYNNVKEKVSFSFTTEKSFKVGIYVLSVFESGKEIGKTTFEIM